MSTSPSSSSRLLARCAGGSFLLVLLLILCDGLILDLTAQNPAKKPPKEEVEEADPLKPKKKIVVEEKEEPIKTKPKKKILVGDEEPGPKAPTPIADANDLLLAAQQTPNTAVARLYSNLAVPHDELSWGDKNNPVTHNVQPIAEFIDPRKPGPGNVHVRILDKDWKPERVYTPQRDRILSYVPYEQLAQTQVDEFLRRSLDKLPEMAKDYLSYPEMLAVVETGLTRVIRFHESGQRRGPGWDAVEKSLRDKLFDIQLKHLQFFVDRRDWDGAFTQARKLATFYRKPEEQLKLVQPLVKLIEARGFNPGQLHEVLSHFRQLEEQFPNSPAIKPINEGLRKEAERLFREAKVKIDQKQLKEAQELLKQAEELWPRLPDVHDYRLRLNREYAVLRVGVRDLPERLWPTTASTDSERQAVELLFEGLVKLSPDSSGGQRYQPGVAEGLPRLVPLGRQFQLGRRAYWSNGEAVTADDVVNTVQLLKDAKWAYYSPAWAKLLEHAEVSDDRSRVSLILHQGFHDPLSLMTFKILPRQPYEDFALTRADDPRLNDRKPVGSGSFQYKGKETTGGRPDAAVFVANPHYRKEDAGAQARSGAGKGRAQIREIHFFRCEDPVKDFRTGSLDLLLDLPAAKVKELQKEVPDIRVPPPLPNRRIYFLAVNHRRGALRDHAGVPADRDPGRLLRRAVALAIQREEILNRCFRIQDGEKVHRPLNGPYPPDSWACDSSLQGLDNAEVAKTLGKAAVKSGLSEKRLSLLYPDDDPQAAEAMKALKNQVEKALEESGIELVLQPHPPHKLRELVEETNQYDLAYYHYDYPSEAYWLWPLFAPRTTDSGSDNYLGYSKDSELMSLFGKAMGRREFAEVKKLTHQIHDLIHHKLPFIPLWQIDTRVALHPDLKPVPFDPLVVFTDIDQWRLEKK